MEFSTEYSPHPTAPTEVSRVMREVLYALVPGVLCTCWFFGIGVAVNILLCVAVALIAEASIVVLRKRDVSQHLGDYSAVVTGVLLGIALPPLAPWWVAVVGTLFAIVIAKHLYGGLGFNPFNPAMVGYVVLLISFPLEMTLWSPPAGISTNGLGMIDSMYYLFSGSLPAGVTLDTLTMATPLDVSKTELSLNRTLQEIMVNPLFGDYGGTGWQPVNFWFLLGGLWLMQRRIIYWQIPVGMLGAIVFMSSVFYVVDSDTFLSPAFHLFSGASMIGAFFIATDPVSAATSKRGRLYYGIGIGVFVYVIRTWGGYPDGVAFAVLLMNMAAPAIDYFCRQRTFGHPDE